jgi:hypothetical protein
MTYPWVLELAHADHRAFISPMTGHSAPYRLQMIHPNGEMSVFIGLATMERVIESLCTRVACCGGHVPIQVRADWNKLAMKYDQPEERGYVQ